MIKRMTAMPESELQGLNHCESLSLELLQVLNPQCRCRGEGGAGGGGGGGQLNHGRG